MMAFQTMSVTAITRLAIFSIGPDSTNTRRTHALSNVSYAGAHRAASAASMTWRPPVVLASRY